MNGIGEFLQKLLDYAVQLWPLTVIEPWETGVRVRLGKMREVLAPGLHFVIPYADEAFVAETNVELFSAGKQTIDGVTFEVIGAFKLVDVRLFYRELNDEALVAVGMAVAAAASSAMTGGAWKGATDAMLKAVLHKSRLRARRWGIRIDWLEFKTVTDSPTLRLLTDAAQVVVAGVA